MQDRDQGWGSAPLTGQRCPEPEPSRRVSRSSTGKGSRSLCEPCLPSNPFNEGEHGEACFEVFEEGQVVYSEELLESASSGSEESECATETNEEVFHKKFDSAISGVPQAVEGRLMQNKRSRMLHLRSPDLRNKLQPVTECGLHGP